MSMAGAARLPKPGPLKPGKAKATSRARARIATKDVDDTDTSDHTGKARLSPADRERQIIDGAIAYFSEVGFSGQTRELSKRLGITQPLLYRYFSSKQVLVDRVYQTVFEGRWNPAWIGLLQNRAIPLRERLMEFYRQYSEATYRPDWIRIYMYAGLSGPVLNQRYIKLIRRELMPVYARELRHYCGLENVKTPVTDEEVEFIWSLHGGLFYYAVRHHIYKLRMTVDFMTKAAFAIDNFLAGARTTYPALLAALSSTANLPAQKSRGSRGR
jgi:AcrR family transcriptional regulator